MKNGHLETWQVVLWLKKYPTHTADAPQTDKMFASRASSPRSGSFVTFETFFLEWDTDPEPYQRSDWTVYNERGRKVRFKTKARIVDTGVPVNRDDLIHVCSRNSDHVFARIVVTGRGGTILIRRRKA